MENSQKRGRVSSIVAKGLSLSVLTLVSRILGLIREITKANFLGTKALGDAFGIAFQVPNFLRRLFAENSVSVAFIPTFKSYIETADTPEGKKTAQEFVNATFTLLTFLTVVFVSLGMVFTPLIIKIFFKETSGSAYDESVILTRIMFPYLIVISIAALFQGILNALKIFSPSGFTPILFNAIVIAFTYIFAPYTANPARAMAIGVITGGTVQAAFQLPFVLRQNWKIGFTSLKNAFTNPGTRTVLRLIGPTIIGMSAYQLNDLVSSTLATHAGEGIYSSLQYSLRLQELILGICAVTIGTVILPDLTGFARRNEWERFNRMLTQAIRIMALIAIPITFYSLIMGQDIIALVFKTGEFNEQSVQMTLEVFKCHMLGLFFIAVNRIVSPAFYAQQDTKSPTIAGLINFAINIALAVILVKPLKGAGIALALSIASIVNMIVLFIFLHKTPTIDVKSVVLKSLLYALKMVVLSVIACIPVVLLKDRLQKLFSGHGRLIANGLPVLITVLIFAAVGVALLFITKDPLVKSMLHKEVNDGK
ncbi:MAG: murein biosynthesis integral membrane protein MurJ [Treponema sp.]|nr:murein biosynthesis integral membrane protein MurJ [Treponema sp.]